MMLTIEVVEPDPLFACAAEKIGNEPWLVAALTQFGGLVGSELTAAERQRVEIVSKQLNDAVDTLMRWLPAYRHIGGWQSRSNDVEVMLAVLPRVKADIARLNRERKGRGPDIRREICAAVILECWTLARGEAQPRSEKLYGACDAYWKACGNEDIGDLENWRHSVQRAFANDRGWIRDIVSAVKNGP
jgi:hypothetical protein